MPKKASINKYAIQKGSNEQKNTNAVDKEEAKEPAKEPEIMTDFDPDLKQISGPTNVARLEGEIHGIKKVVYLFMDYHEPVYGQTECPSVFKQDVDEFFAHTFYNLNKTSNIYDFFLEIRPSQELYPGANNNKWSMENKSIYIAEVMKFFKKVFKYDKDTNKVAVSDSFKNIRLHYLDVRDYLKLHLMRKLDNLGYKSFQITQYGLSAFDLEEMIKILTDMRDEILQIADVIKNTTDDPKERTAIVKKQDPNAADITTLKQLVYKIKYRYNYADIGETLNNMLNEIVENMVDYSKYLDYVISQYHIYKTIINETYGILIRDDRLKDSQFNYGPSHFDIRAMKHNIGDFMDIINVRLIFIFARMTDIYLLRRILDKDYVTTAIVYTGQYHSANYIYNLVKYFDFKITHIAYSAITDLNELNKKIKEINLEEVTELIYRPMLFQCSDITNFPKNFS